MALPQFVQRTLTNINQIVQVFNQTQQDLSAVLNAILVVPILNGHLVANQSLAVGRINQVPHGLNRKLRGYIIILKDSNSNVHDSQTINPSPATYLNLSTDTPCTVSIWVF